MKQFMLVAIAVSLAVSGCTAHNRVSQSAEARGGFSPATVDTKRNAFVVHNLVYSQSRHKSLEQTLDLYLPAFGKPPYPLIIWIHGGSWMYGDKNEDCVACDYLLGKFAVASVNYRLDTEAHFPSQIHDLKAAIRFLRANARTYKLDADRIGVWGVSAGGHLAALLGTSGDRPELEGDEGWSKQSSRVQAVCDWSGPTDFNTAQSQAPPYCKIKFSGQSSPVYVLMGGKMDEKSLAEASPVTYVSKDDPPFLIMHGDKDDAIPPLQSQELYDALKKAGCDVQLVLEPGYGHALGSPEQLKKVKEFFEAKLGSRKATRGQ
jgi:acetyl esterase/lipase